MRDRARSISTARGLIFEVYGGLLKSKLHPGSTALPECFAKQSPARKTISGAKSQQKTIDPNSIRCFRLCRGGRQLEVHVPRQSPRTYPQHCRAGNQIPPITRTSTLTNIARLCSCGNSFHRTELARPPSPH